MGNPFHRPRVYISGKMHGVEDYNRPLFEKYHTLIALMGLDPLNPHDLDYDPELPDCNYREDYYRRDMKVLMDCQMVVVLPDWKDSRGARLEVFVAHTCGIPIFRLDEAADALIPVRKWEIPGLEFRPVPTPPKAS